MSLIDPNLKKYLDENPELKEDVLRIMRINRIMLIISFSIIGIAVISLIVMAIIFQNSPY